MSCYKELLTLNVMGVPADAHVPKDGSSFAVWLSPHYQNLKIADGTGLVP
ncbi:hypothetical protein L798_10017 [Zootermopsis nevadensis]|uniref:Uncharacterized protein n=1 Tax=Zootermopsis nevadensis TaxID=136037 RepID=A0A067R0A5_ZOONE|nr:hypothetical protein L798_10017 [Zootermopsis nevadensis]